jgi:hypothetical protein
VLGEIDVSVALADDQAGADVEHRHRVDGGYPVAGELHAITIVVVDDGRTQLGACPCPLPASGSEGHERKRIHDQDGEYACDTTDAARRYRRGPGWSTG